MSSTGSNKTEDLFRSRASHRLEPYGGVTDGGGLVTATAAAGVVTLSATTAKVLLDTLPFTLAAGTLVTPALQNGVNTLSVYVNPVREVLAVTTLPATGTAGQLVMLVNPAGQFDLYLNNVYLCDGTAWVIRDNAVSVNLDPNKPYVPQDAFLPSSSDFRNLPNNKIVGAALAFEDEKAIIYPSNYGLPPNLPGIGGSYARFASGFLLAKVRVTLTAGAIANAATDVVITRPASVDLIC